MNLKDKILIMIQDLFTKQYLSLWLKINLRRTSWLEERIPFLPFRMTDWLDQHLKPDMRVFEYGSGGSTIFTAERVKSIVTVEHDREWFQYMNVMLNKFKITNCKYILIEPKIDDSSQLQLSETSKLELHDAHKDLNKDYDKIDEFFRLTKRFFKASRLSSKSLEDYVSCIDEYGDAYFDLVIVDGRSRNSCVAHAIPKVRRGGFLLLDDSNRKSYQPSRSLLEDHPKKEFYGIGAGFNQMTTIWKIY